jgi:hypothetical protein
LLFERKGCAPLFSCHKQVTTLNYGYAMTDALELPKPKSLGSADSHHVSAQIWSPENRTAFANLARGNVATGRSLIEHAGISIVPCTPAGMDPMKDPANPKAPNYDANTYGPKPPEPMPLIPQSGVITPEQLELRKKLGTIYAPQFGAYDGACKVYPDKDVPPSDAPMS